MSDTRWGPPIDVMPVFRDEQRALLTLLPELPDLQWDAPSACTGWTVHDLAAHLLGNHLGRLSRDRDGYERLAPRAGEEFPAFLHRVNAEWVTAAARLSPRVLVALLDEAASRVVDYWESVDPDEIGGPVYWAGPVPAPRWLDCAREYTECWVHHQQIREAVDAPRLDDPRFRAPVIDTFVRALPYTLRDTRASEGTDVTVVVPGDSGGAWTATRTADGWVLRRGRSDHPSAELTTDADTFWRLCARGVTPEDADVTATGETSLVDDVLRIVSIIH